MLLEKSKRLRETCKKKKISHKEVKDHKSRNILSKVQSRKTCYNIQVSHNNLKKSTLGKRNSFIYSTITGNTRTKRFIAASKAKNNMIEISKGGGY